MKNKKTKSNSSKKKDSSQSRSFKETYLILNNSFKILKGGDDLAKSLAIDAVKGDSKEFFLLFSNANTKKLKSLIAEVIDSTEYKNIESEINFSNHSIMCSIDIIPKGKAALLLIKDITKKTNTIDTLKKSQKNLRQLTQHLHHVREEERSNFAREVHDDLGQKLTALQIELGLLLKKIKKKNYKVGQRQIYKDLQFVNELLNQTIDSKKQLISEFRLDFLDEFGLIESMRHYLEEFRTRYDIEYYFYSDWNYLDIKYSKSVAFYRIFQEALMNVVKHSGATKVDISIFEKRDKIYLTIEDNGKGIDSVSLESKEGLGLIGMKERILLEGGRFSIKGNNGKGTRLQVSAKLEQ